MDLSPIRNWAEAQIAGGSPSAPYDDGYKYLSLHKTLYEGLTKQGPTLDSIKHEADETQNKYLGGLIDGEDRRILTNGTKLMFQLPVTMTRHMTASIVKHSAFLGVPGVAVAGLVGSALRAVGFVLGGAAAATTATTMIAGGTVKGILKHTPILKHVIYIPSCWFGKVALLPMLSTLLKGAIALGRGLNAVIRRISPCVLRVAQEVAGLVTVIFTVILAVPIFALCVLGDMARAVGKFGCFIFNRGDFFKRAAQRAFVKDYKEPTYYDRFKKEIDEDSIIFKGIRFIHKMLVRQDNTEGQAAQSGPETNNRMSDD
jgi:hypothetical protein